MIIERNFKNSFLSFVKGYRNCNNIHRFDISNYELRENFGSNKYPYKGLKTKPKISEVMNFPDSIPIDYMHLVLLGMFKKLGELYLPVIKKSIINYNFF